MASNSMRALLEHDLSSLYDGQLVLVDLLARIADDTAPSEASDALRSHVAESERHAELAVRCFTLLELPTRRTVNNAIRGLARDYDLFVAETLTGETLIHFALGSASRATQLEIASYMNLLRQAHTLGAVDVAYYLAECLRVEQMTARTLERIADSMVSDVGTSGERDANGFRLSYYTEIAVQTPITIEDDGSASRSANTSMNASVNTSVNTSVDPSADTSEGRVTKPAPPAVTQWRPTGRRR